MARLGSEQYNKGIYKQAYSQENIANILSQYINDYKSKLEGNFNGHSFVIYGVVSECGKLSRRSVSIEKSSYGYDTATQFYIGAVIPEGIDCLLLVTSIKTRQGQISANIKNGKEGLESEVKEIITRHVQGKTFNETGNTMIAMNISKEIKKLVEREEPLCNSIIGTIILEPGIEYNDYLTHTVNDNIELLQVNHKDDTFLVLVLISLIPLN